MKIYVASSWRCPRQPEVVQALRARGHEVYDFKNPAPGNNGFGWRQITPFKTPAEFRKALEHETAQAGFKLDMDALATCDACVLVLPCGRSAHLELGYAVGAGKATIVLMDEVLDEPELMYLMCDKIAVSIDEVIAEIETSRAWRDAEDAVNRRVP